MDLVPVLAALAALAGLTLAGYFYVAVTRESPGNDHGRADACHPAGLSGVPGGYQWVAGFVVRWLR